MCICDIYAKMFFSMQKERERCMYRRNFNVYILLIHMKICTKSASTVPIKISLLSNKNSDKMLYVIVYAYKWVLWLNNIFHCLSSHVWNECWACSVQPLWSNEIPTVQNNISMLSWCAWNKYRQFYDKRVPPTCLCPSPDLHTKAPKHLRMKHLVCLMFYITNEMKVVWQHTECRKDTHTHICFL